jgi:hypothetical protein
MVQKMQTTNDALVALKLILEDDRKHKTLERALALTDLNSFYYYDNTGAGKKNSSDLAKTVLGWFMLGRTMTLRHEPTLTKVIDLQSKSVEEKDDNIKAFAERFAKMIRELIKKEPRLLKRDDGMYSISYE